ncbi:MAG TPA: hypothetical protein VFP80_10755 [Thermoanaerobaculia bacterium]|nr:hypothetical protein [Thermoanaerobaculia bacterium]
MGSLTVHFRGICTHFSHRVPGIPHRVVLPDATPLRFGFVDIPNARGGLPYVLPPHLAILRVRGERHQRNLKVPGAMENGIIFEGLRLQVVNATEDRVVYSPEYCEVVRLAHFVDGYQFSDEIVLGGRASCYFDVTAGCVMPDVARNTEIAGVMIKIKTHKKPVLLASPFFQDPPIGSAQQTERGPTSFTIKLPPGDDVKLIVGNIGPGCCDGGADGFDFLLNYLTLKGGIPRQLKNQPPQINVVKPEPFTAAMAKAIERLKLIRSPKKMKLPKFEELLSDTLSCSNTQYP